MAACQMSIPVLSLEIEEIVDLAIADFVYVRLLVERKVNREQTKTWDRIIIDRREVSFHEQGGVRHESLRTRVSESYGIFAAISIVDNADSSVRSKVFTMPCI